MTDNGAEAGSVLRLHASAVALHGVGALILGPSGSGKSGLALQLMALGAELIADDQTLCISRDGAVWLSAPDHLPEMIEARGVGLLPARLCGPVPLGLVIDLSVTETARLPETQMRDILGQSVRCVHNVEAAHFPAAICHYLKGHADLLDAL